MKKIVILIILLLTFSAQFFTLLASEGRILYEKDLRTGASRFDEYLPLIKGKKVALVANQTSMVGTTHLVDTLRSLKVRIELVFAPEHGFRGESGAGEKIKSGLDPVTGIRIISLYGKHLKPNAQDLNGIDIVLFDIQDVGARFYTFISTLQYVMEACAENNKSLIVLDRPNPNGFYVDGPVLDTAYRSFVGLARIPVVHGMTIGEYSRMLNGEGWLKGGKTCKLTVIKCTVYQHMDYYQLPVPPSPNLPNMDAVYLYPSLCFFEGTKVSLGRGTAYPFQWIGFPGYQYGDLALKPKSIPNAAPNPPYRDTLCQGLLLKGFSKPSGAESRIRLEWLMNMYRDYPDREMFFNSFFEKLAGTSRLRKQIINGKSEDEIHASWNSELKEFRQIRKKYLLYTDFE